MNNWKQYRRTNIAEMRPYIEGEILPDSVSISLADLRAGSPKIGDMIARNPENHDDQWLVAFDYFYSNFEPLNRTISYSTNMMGPANLDWYKKRGLTKIVTYVVESEYMSQLLKIPIGATYENEEISEHWATGRIDIYGLDEKEYYGGMSEYSLPPMLGKDWNTFSDWLENFTTDTLWEFDDIIAEYEKTNPKITWDKYRDE